MTRSTRSGVWCMQNVRYRTFVHQAILSATALSLVAPQEFLVLPGTYNYPLHLHSDFSL